MVAHPYFLHDLNRLEMDKTGRAPRRMAELSYPLLPKADTQIIY